MVSPLVITVIGSPISVNRLYRTNGFGGVRLSKEGENWKQIIGWEARRQYKGAMTSKRLSVHLYLHFKDNRRIDIDNQSKAILDALQGIVYEDDRQVDELHIYRRQDPANPRVEISIIELP